MPFAPVPKRVGLAFLAAGALAGIGAPGASATICPGSPAYVPGDPNQPVGVGMYCVFSGNAFYRDVTRTAGPNLYFRLGDGAGTSVMTGDNGLTSGEYKNAQASNPIGIADDGDAARHFYGSSGYGYVNGIDAPNFHGSSPYGNYTMEAWFRLDSGVTDGAILEFGRAGQVFVSSKTVYFKNGDDSTGGITIPDANLNNWHFVVATKCGNRLTLQLQMSTQDPFVWWQPDRFGGVATGTSTYRPEGQPTFYVGYSNLNNAPWFEGSLDEAAYFRYCVGYTVLFNQYEDDPVPDPSTMVAGGPVGGTTPATGTAASHPKPTKPGPLTKAQRIKALKLQIKSLGFNVRRLKIAYTQLAIHGASKTKLKHAKAAIAKVEAQLAKAKKALKTLQAKPKPKPKPKKHASAKRH
jgi:hypothetical protein